MEFASINVEGMNETDVRETIVRPFIHALGYAHNTVNNIRTEVTLRYEKAFLGRKSPSKDPPLRGRADYICEVISHGRWVVEVKAPHEDLTLDISQQAHTYAAHPDVAALYYLVTNGKEFKVYRTSHPDAPALAWHLAATKEKFSTIRNIIGPAAIKRQSLSSQVDTGKPLAEGIGSTARIVGGYLTYDDHYSINPQINAGLGVMNGMRATINGRSVVRTEHGLIRAEVDLVRSNNLLDALNRASGFETLVFESAVDFVSTDEEQPSIFQNIAGGEILAGTVMQGISGIPPFQIPFPIQTAAFTQAVCYFDGSSIQGTFSMQYFYDVPNPSMVPFQFRQFVDSLKSAGITGAGTFIMNVV
ncbi:type I restriction enzyme HsdR N-terminal domain-containing protein [Methylobacterium sp. J-078]|uniref:type I restriction enzyme HsdR N-terminal domain-containing protein n=1 Tax=Methylobacterium sp. J-078 TaxID=2836657 RepID=UPI001FBB0AAE|nr:type I restriction enzyme HsdR N-terminal domain-containing protein [Methylobacterium sp. J-078]MCJ2043805.1 type I restriction enzyme HsdR N-terminal domain-containing protein [Methylobacterium sp. J-078]